MKDSWWDRKAKELQEAADKHNIKQFYEDLWAVYGPRSSSSSLIRISDGETPHRQVRHPESLGRALQYPSQLPIIDV